MRSSASSGGSGNATGAGSAALAIAGQNADVSLLQAPTHKPMSEAVTAEVTYGGYVTLQTKEQRPSSAHVNAAHRLLTAATLVRPSKLPAEFLDGFGTSMILIISHDTLTVELLEGVGNLLVFGRLLHQIAFVAQVESDLVVIVKESKEAWAFKCMLFAVGSPEKASRLAGIISEYAHAVAMKLHEARTDQPKQQLSEKPSLPPRTINHVADEDQPWYHGAISRDRTEKLLSRNLIGGLYLVRQRESSKSDYVLSFTWKGKVYHNLITRRRDGRLVNINQTVFDSLTQMVTMYQSPHPDLQCVLTEYVQRADDDEEEEYEPEPPEYMNLSSLARARLSIATNEVNNFWHCLSLSNPRFRS